MPPAPNAATDMTSHALEMRDLRKGFASAEGPIEVLCGVSLALARGRSLALTGESGSGKSTLLHIAAGLEKADGGSVRVAGQDMTQADDLSLAEMRRGAVGLIFQQFNLIPSLTVEANLAFQARLAGRHDPQFTDRLATRLGLDGLRHRYPEQLSGGQQQRVAVGRCLAARPALVLADEPTGNLDEATGDAVLSLMLELTAETGAALLLVTHSPRLAARCDAQVHLRQGQIESAA